MTPMKQTPFWALLALVLLVAPVAAGQAAAGAGGHPMPVKSDPNARSVPFGPGEEAVYQLKLGVFSVGEGGLAVKSVETVHGQSAYRLAMWMKGGLGPAKVDDTFESWMDVRTLASRRFIRDIHEVNYKSRREWAIFPDEKRWERVDEAARAAAARGQSQDGKTLSNLPLDELAFVYYIRTLPLKVGETFTLNRYFKDDGNPVVVKVLRKERKEVPAGTFNTIVVQPIIKTSGLFSEGGNAEIYFTDDASRHVVYLRSEIPVVGSVSLHLREIREGTPLNPRRSGAAGATPTSR